MVGDGINDSAALAQADLSIAMGQGSDIAMDVAKMTIISSDLHKITDAIHLSVLTVRTIRQNLSGLSSTTWQVYRSQPESFTPSMVFC